MQDNKITLLFTGDLIPMSLDTKADTPFIRLDDSLLKLFDQVDLRITNLECPLTDSPKKIEKTGPALKAVPSDIWLLKDLHIDVACLSNNHIRDYGEEGVLDTINICNKNGIRTVGAGKDSKDAAKILYIEINHKKIAFLNFSENEYNFSTTDRAGSNPDDPIHIWRSVQEAQNNSDFQIAIMHGGKEMHNQPTPYQVRLFRYVADLGVNAVIGHHTHVIGGYEIYNDIPIVYSLGNFIFDEPGNPPAWDQGALAIITLGDNEEKTLLDFYNVETRSKTVSISNSQLTSKGQKDVFMYHIDDEHVKNAWQEVVKKQYFGTIKAVSNLSLLDRILLKLKVKKLDNKPYFMALANRFRCRTHRIFTQDTIDYFITK